MLENTQIEKKQFNQRIILLQKMNYSSKMPFSCTFEKSSCYFSSRNTFYKKYNSRLLVETFALTC